MTGILIAGTSSDAGKSLVCVGLCRALQRRGIDVVPFKSQNMSNNSMVCRDGAEIGRAQYLQAQGAKVEATSAMNPVLLKPGTDRRSFVVLRGQPNGVLESGQYATGRRHLAEGAYAAYEELASSHELVVCEGAGSPAEINLRDGDYVNFGLAQQFGLPVVLVGDIDRGGLLASLYGTWGICRDDDRPLLAGYIVNKFRGDVEILKPGLETITERTGMANFGVLPYLHDVWLDGEDALEVGRWRHDQEGASGLLTVAVVDLPRISNATDVDALAAEPGVNVVVTTDAGTCQSADIVVVPGSRSTVSDLAWLRERGIAEVLVQRHADGLPILGICGGYQMLSRIIHDDVESQTGGDVEGLSILPVEVTFGADKILGRPQGSWHGVAVEGYEIHHGICVPQGEYTPFLDGVENGNSFGTMWHGALESDDFRRAWLTEIAERIGNSWRPTPGAIGYADRREAMIEKLADAIEANVDVDGLLALARKGR